jgi:hypothetical protein
MDLRERHEDEYLHRDQDKWELSTFFLYVLVDIENVILTSSPGRREGDISGHHCSKEWDYQEFESAEWALSELYRCKYSSPLS